MPKPTASSVIIGIIYVVLLGSLVMILALARQSVIVSEGSASSLDDWQQWRHEAERQHTGEGPVARRVPKSSEPPSLVLLRDHFGTSLTILLVLSSALFFAMAFMLRGILVGPNFHPDLSPDND
ncbi:MAG: hypothetical protein H6822_29440 [Planctomycetaceae bacterium]|nr:hypothetical protein [Planctomycetales bacterium]MCB9926307.1 hypothetical protein [Planctomycetaceae bacterium]